MGVTEEQPLDVAAIREDFPILDRDVHDDVPLVYLDNAATSLTPEPVLDAQNRYYREFNANVHRGLHQLSQEASIAYEEAHDRVAAFIGAAGREELVFTKNTTEAINLVAYAWGLNELEPGDEVVLTEMEHHSALVTWQQIADRTGATIEFIPLDEAGRVDLDAAADVIGPDTAMVSTIHVSNVLGSTAPVAELADIAHEHDALVFVDGAQAVPHRPVDVKALDADFYAFSGHKMLGPTGIGGLYGRQSLLEEMEPFNYGGGMIESVTFERSTWNELPWKFEAGTQPIAEGIALGAAADYLDDVGVAQIQHHGESLAAYAHERLEAASDVTVYGPPPDERAALVSFTLDGVHAHDLSSIVDDDGVAVRAGDHCTQPLHDRLDVPATARASFYLYNTRSEVDALVESLDRVREILTEAG